MRELLDSSIESQIVGLLKETPLSTISIIEKIQKIRPGTPKQSVYLSLRKLKQKEVVAISKKTVSLHQVWISKMKNFFMEAGQNFTTSNEINLLKLKEGEYITYKFNSLLSLDMFWAHAFSLLMNTLSPQNPVYLYNPHEWFLIARKQSELSIIKEAQRRGVPWIQLIAGKTSLDLDIKKYFDEKNAKCHLLGKDLFTKNYYANCFGDFLIEVWLDDKSVEKIENIYNTNTISNTSVINLLQKIVEEEGLIHKMKISKNKSKAAKLKSVFAKYFVLNLI